MIDMSRLYQVSNAKTRSLSAENPTGAPGKGGMCPLEEGSAKYDARELGVGWKVNPWVNVEAGATVTIADVDGPGVINHIWIANNIERWRELILRFYWDDQEIPSVECPIGDFFCQGWNVFRPITSLAVCTNPDRAFNCYWQMPFKKHCRITVENRSEKTVMVFYQITYTVDELPEEVAYFHAQFRRTNPLPYKEVYTILDGVKGKGQYVGTYLAWGTNNNGWWGEGEIKFYMDGDSDWPTICGTGTEDYFCGAWCFQDSVNTVDGRMVKYGDYTTPYSGFHTIPVDGFWKTQTRFGMYRWHIVDPIHFERDLRITIQALGWRSGHRLLPLQEDIASVAFWYQTLPTAPFPELPDKDYMETI